LVSHAIGRRCARGGAAFGPLLDGLDLADVVVTTDALQTPPRGRQVPITGKRALYLFTVKANQPTLLDRCRVCPGTASRSWTAPAAAPSGPTRSTISGSPTPPKSSKSPAPPTTCTTIPGGARP
jgi:hypothetical protein